MVHDCYLEYVATGQGPNWPAPTIAQNCLLDPLLKATRGMLLWEHQYDAIAREALKEFHRDVTVDDIEETKWGCEEYLNGAESERASLVKKLYVADTSFVDMVRERLLVGRPLMLNSVSLEQSRLAQILWNWRIY